MRSERLTFLVTPEEKATIAARADGLGITASDLIRLAVEAYGEEEANTLQALAQMFADTMAECRASLDAINTRVENSLDELARSRIESKAAA